MNASLARLKLLVEVVRRAVSVFVIQLVVEEKICQPVKGQKKLVTKIFAIKIALQDFAKQGLIPIAAMMDIWSAYNTWLSLESFL